MKIFLMASIVLTTVGLVVGCASKQAQVSISNPASVYCEQHGGTLETVTDTSGGQMGNCHLPSGIVCDERAYFRGECGVHDGDTTAYISPLGFSLELPGACSSDVLVQEGSAPQYNSLKDLSISSPNGDLQIQCFLPTLQEPKEIIHLTLHTYPCDADGIPVTIGNHVFDSAETVPGLGVDQGKWCYKIPLENNTVFITFLEKAYIEQILGSLVIK